MTTDATTSRGILGYACGAMGGVLGALALGLDWSHSGSICLVLGYVISICLFMSGLGAGILAGFIACFASALGLLVTSPAVFGSTYILIEAVPAIGLIWLAMRRNVLPGGQIAWGSEGSVLAALVTYPCIIFLVIYFSSTGHPGGLLGMTTEAFGPMTDQVAAKLAADGYTITPDTPLLIQRLVDMVARIFPALAMCTWIFTTLIAMVFAQGILSKQGWSLRPNFALTELKVPTWMIYAAAITGGVGTFASQPYDYVGTNLALILGLPFFFVGLAVVHAAAAQTRMPLLTLFAFYVFISVITYLVLLVALLGVVDQWVDFRKRFAAGVNNQGRKS